MSTKKVSAAPTVVPCCGSLAVAPLSSDEATAMSKIFAALSDPARLRLLSLIAVNTEICSCDLESPLGKSQPTISHHTRLLADAGIIHGEKRGRWTWWSVVPERLQEISNFLAR